MSGALIWLAFYLGVLGIFTWRGRKVSHRDYLNSSKDLSAWDSTWTTYASLLTGYNFVLGVTFSYLYGFWYLMAFAGAGGAFVVLFVFFKKRLVSLQQTHNLFSVGDYFGVIYGRLPRIIVNVIFCGALFLFLTLQMHINCELFEGLFGVSKLIALVLTVGVVSLYLWLGGFKTSVKTDVFQGVLLFPITLTIFVFPSHFAWDNIPLLFDKSQAGFAFGLAALQFLSLLAQPESFQRVFAGRSVRVVGQGLARAFLLVALIAGSIAYLGMNFRLAGVEIEPQRLFTDSVLTALPQWLASILAVSLVAAFMGTIDSSAFALGVLLAGGAARQDLTEGARLTRRFTLLSIILAGFSSLYLTSFLSSVFALISLVSLVGAAVLLSLVSKITSAELVAFLLLGSLTYVWGLFRGLVTENPLTSLIPSILGFGLIFLAKAIRTISGRRRINRKG